MNPFLELPMIVTEPKRPTLRWFLGLSQTKAKKEVVGRLMPGDIAAHHPNGDGTTRIILKSGQVLHTPLPCEDVDAARQTYDVVIRKNPGRTNNLQIVRKRPANDPGSVVKLPVKAPAHNLNGSASKEHEGM